MGIAFIPTYIKYLGIEAYGLIGLFAVLQAWLALLDMGMTPTLNREMARYIAGVHSVISIRDLLRSIEIIALSIAFLIVFSVWFASDWLTTDWLRTEKLPEDVVAQAFSIMGVVTALRFLEAIYRSAIIGLQRQVLYNVVVSILATFRSLGAVCILAWWSPTIDVFFLWQGLVSMLTLGLLAKATYNTIPVAQRSGRFSIVELQRVGGFVGGMMGITLLALLLTQIDKILLSKLLTLSDYGYYTLATAVATSLYMLVNPIAQAWFPRLSQLHAENNQTEFVNKFHEGAQLVSVLMGSAALVMIAFAPIVLQIWTQDSELVLRSSKLTVVLALGTLLNGLTWIPYQAQLAYGWTRLTLWINVVSVTLIVPAIIWITPRYGAEGAAWVWVMLNAGYLLVGVHFMFRKILTLEKWRWYSQDLGQPLLTATTVALTTAWLMPDALSTFSKFFWVLLSSVFTVFAAALSASTVRVFLLRQIRLLNSKE